MTNATTIAEEDDEEMDVLLLVSSSDATALALLECRSPPACLPGELLRRPPFAAEGCCLLLPAASAGFFASNTRSEQRVAGYRAYAPITQKYGAMSCSLPAIAIGHCP